MKNNTAIILSVIGAVLIYLALSGNAWRILGSKVDEHGSFRQSNGLAKAQAQAAAELRKQLPLKLDKYTTLQTVISVGPTIVYSYIVDIKFEEIDLKIFSEESLNQLKYNVCRETSMRDTMRAGGAYRYIYFSNDGKTIGSHTLNENVCGRSNR